MLELYETIAENALEAADEYLKTKDRLRSLFEPLRNKTVERYEFRRLMKRESETVDQYVSRLKIAGRYCKFSRYELASQVVQGCLSESLRRQLLKEANFTLAVVIEKGRIHHTVESKQRLLNQSKNKHPW